VSHRPCWILAVAAALSLSTTARVAAAEPRADVYDPREPATSQYLFYEARSLMQRGRWAEACPKLEESLRLDAGMGTQFNLADCHEHVGKVASAWGGFLDVAAQARAANQPERERVARKRAASLEPRLPKLRIDAQSLPAGTEVQRDGVPVAPATLGTPIPVDPGRHVVTATVAAGERGGSGKQFSRTVEVGEGQTSVVVVPAEDGWAAAAPLVATRERGTVQRPLGWVIAGLGVAGVGVGMGFGLSSMASRDESQSHCTGERCDAAGVQLRDDALRTGDIATAATIAGAAALATGLVLVLTAPRGQERIEPRSRGVRSAPPGPRVQAGMGGAILGGTF